MIKVAIADPDPQFEKEIEKLLEMRPDMVVVASARSLNQVVSLVEECQPNVLLIGPGMGEDIAISFAKKLTGQHPVGCILLTFSLPAYHKQAAMRANIVEVIQVPADPERLSMAIQMAAGFAQQLAIRDESAQPQKKCAVLTVFSTKGGVGKTVLSTNMAAAIARATEGRVVLIDLDLQFGDVGIAMGLSPERTILDFADHAPDADSKMIDDMLLTHPSGLKVLLAPKEPESADLITGERVVSIMSALKNYADFIIIDTPASFNDNVLAALDESDEICLVLTLDLPSVKNIKLCLRTLSELKYEHVKYKMVVNRVESNVGLKVAEVEKVLNLRAVAAIDADRAVPLSLNKGVPVVLDEPKLPVSKEIDELALMYVNKYRPDLLEVKMTG